MQLIDLILRLTVIVAVIAVGMGVIDLQHRVSELEEMNAGGEDDGES